MNRFYFDYVSPYAYLAWTRLRPLAARVGETGVFGVATMLLRGELFWGDDALPYLEGFARGEETIDPVSLERWRTLPAAATHKA